MKYGFDDEEYLEAMTASELIDALKALPPEARVMSLWDGAARSCVCVAYLAQSGAIVLADHGDVVYHNRDRPATAPDAGQDAYWRTP